MDGEEASVTRQDASDTALPALGIDTELLGEEQSTLEVVDSDDEERLEELAEEQETSYWDLVDSSSQHGGMLMSSQEVGSEGDLGNEEQLKVSCFEQVSCYLLLTNAHML